MTDCPVDDSCSGVASYKSVPSVSGPCVFPPLFPGSCSKCSPLTNITCLDPVSSKLGHVDLLERGVGRNLVQQVLFSYLQLQYVGGVVISPGQLEVLARVSQGTVVLMVTEHQLSPTDLTILCLSLAHQPSLSPPLVAGLGDTWPHWLLLRAGLASQYQHVAQLGQGRLVISQFDGALVSSLIERELYQWGAEVVCVPALVSHEAESCGRRVRVEVGQPMSVREMLGGGSDWGLEQLSHHLTVSTRRLARVSPAQLLAFLLHTAHSPSQPTVSSLSLALTDLLLLLSNNKVELTVTRDREDIVRAGVEGLGGHIDLTGQVHITIPDIELWRLSRSVESHLVGESLVALVVLGTARPGFLTCRESNRAGGPTVTLEELAPRATTLVLLTGMDTTAQAPCEDLHQLVLAGLRALEMLDCLGPVKLVPPSQHGASARQRTRHRSYTEDEARPAVVETTRLAVGLTSRGRRCLTWLGGLLRYRVTNLGFTVRAMQAVREMRGATMEEVEELVRKEIEDKRDRGWRLSEKSSVSEVTRDSVKALAQSGVVTILNKAGLQLVQVTPRFDSDLVLEEMINLVHEF